MPFCPKRLKDQMAMNMMMSVHIYRIKMRYRRRNESLRVTCINQHNNNNSTPIIGMATTTITTMTIAIRHKSLPTYAAPHTPFVSLSPLYIMLNKTYR